MLFIPIVVPGEPRRAISASHQRWPSAVIDGNRSMWTIWYIFGRLGGRPIVVTVPLPCAGPGLLRQLCPSLAHVQLAGNHVSD